jgi:RNA-directed DNA polymerase
MAVKAKVRTVTRKSSNQSLPILIHRLNPMLRGWANYHRHGASAKTFSDLAAFAWRGVWYGLCHKHPKSCPPLARPQRDVFLETHTLGQHSAVTKWPRSDIAYAR